MNWEQRTKLLALPSYDEQLAMLFQWIKTGVITKNQFVALVKSLSHG